ncbi:hypothetical protein Tco_0322953 [Tanacetum coccineum]
MTGVDGFKRNLPYNTGNVWFLLVHVIEQDCNSGFGTCLLCKWICMADVTGTRQPTSVSRSKVWQNLRNRIVYGEAQDILSNRVVRRWVGLYQELRSRVVKEHDVSGLLVTSGSSVPVSDDKIDPHGCMPSSAVAVPIACENSTYNAIDQSRAPQSVQGSPAVFPVAVYIYDTDNEVSNRMRHFGGANDGSLDPQIVDRLIHILDEHNEFLVVSNRKRQMQRCFCARFQNTAVQHGGVRGYELPTSQGLSGIVFESGPRSRTDYDVIIKTRAWLLSKIKIETHGWQRLFQQYVVNVYCALEQDRMDYCCHILTIAFLINEVLYAIEFQKRGLPHCHTLLWDDPKDKIETTEQIDQYISAELLDPKEDPVENKIMSDMMMHGPCSGANSNALCMQKDLDNSYVVPYNQDLCLAFQAHINVEYYGWSMLIKYVFKYISKAHDGILSKISKPIHEASTPAGNNHVQIDEIQMRFLALG